MQIIKMVELDLTCSKENKPRFVCGLQINKCENFRAICHEIRSGDENIKSLPRPQHRSDPGQSGLLYHYRVRPEIRARVYCESFSKICSI